MSGHIRRRGDHWYVVVELPRDPRTGKRRQRTFRVQGTKRDAERLLREKLHAFDHGTHVEPNTMTVADWLKKWLRDSVEDHVRAKTARDYHERANQITAHLGQIRLMELTALDVEAMYRRLADLGLSSRTIRYDHTVLRKAVDDAVRLGLVGRNVVASARPPRLQQREMSVLTKEQAQALLMAAHGDRLETFVRLALATGMRKGEMLGLWWSDIDWDAGCLYVRRSLSGHGSRKQLTEPKNRTSRRTVTLDATTLQHLRRHRRQHLERRLGEEVGRGNSDLVFVTAAGKPMDPRNVARSFKRLLAKAGLPPTVRIHDLRHTHATLLFEAGEHPKVVSERLGHSSIQITLDVYTHMVPHLQREAATVIEQLIAPPPDAKLPVRIESTPE